MLFIYDSVPLAGGAACTSYLSTASRRPSPLALARKERTSECVALVVRAQSLVTAAVQQLRAQLPFALRGLDTDNDSAFINDTVREYCQEQKLEFTRSHADRKNGQAWVEQKNGAVFRKLIGYERLEGVAATQILQELYATARLYVNFFQPSFKLKGKQCDGAKVHKQYHPPAVPYARLLASETLSEEQKQKLRVQFLTLDPVELLQRIRQQQQKLGALMNAEAGLQAENSPADLSVSLDSLASAWQSGEVRPTHRQLSRPARTWRTRLDPFAAVWPKIEAWLEQQPEATAKELFDRLQQEQSEQFPDSQLWTLQRHIREYRTAIARRLVLGAAAEKKRAVISETPTTTAVPT